MAREGADIFAADMIQNTEESKIVDMLQDSTIFITGATGFIGKMFLEKILRCCPKVKMIYVLVRPKKGKNVEERFQEIFEGPNMVPLKLTNSKYMDKVAIIDGDCCLPHLGLKEDDKEKLIREVDFVIHSAASVRFNEKLKQAAYINVRAVRDLLSLAEKMKNLKGFLHISTAYSHCPRKEIDEKFYEPSVKPENLLQLVEILDDDRLEAITTGLLGEWPNTYSFTKAIAEDVVKNAAKHLPVATIRPSIVIASASEPVAGWIDNFYGATGVFMGAAIGILRSLQGRRQNRADMMPADYIVNGGMAVLWNIASNKGLNDNVEVEEVQQKDFQHDDNPVYNLVSTVETNMTWDLFTILSEKHTPQVPSERQVWHYFFALRPNRIHHLIAVFLLHTVPAHLIDFLCKCIGKKPMMVKGYKKINEFMDVIGYFSMREWDFNNQNVQKLWQKLGKEDQRLFPFSMKDFDWDTYFHFYSRGARVYLLKDPLDTVDKGRIKYWKLFVGHYTLMAVLSVLFLLFLRFLWACLF